MTRSHRFVLFNYWFCIQSIICFIINYTQSYQPHHQYYPYHDATADSYPYKCSRKLEGTLDSMLRRNRLKFGNGRTRIDVTPYSRYHELYGNRDEFDSVLNEKLDIDGKSYSVNVDSQRAESIGESEEYAKDSIHPVGKIEVAEMRVRLPSNGKQPWVMVDKCQFNAQNQTLDTRLVFPDLTISGRVILHPSGGYCNMILRLRRAGIEFRTTPLASRDPHGNSGGVGAGRTRPASVRTDSHFSEPGFLSVFAHGCQGASGIKFRKNSKRNRFDRHDYPPFAGDEYDRYTDELVRRSRSSRYYAQRRKMDSFERGQDSTYEKNSMESSQEDLVNFSDEILDNDSDEHSGRTFSELFSSNSYKAPPLPQRRPAHNTHQDQKNWYNAELANSNEISEALTRELEQLFSIGVRGLLTTYMQKALQPAIKETLMENMGYVLSYG